MSSRTAPSPPPPRRRRAVPARRSAHSLTHASHAAALGPSQNASSAGTGEGTGGGTGGGKFLVAAQSVGCDACKSSMTKGFLFQLNLQFADGSTATVATDDTWVRQLRHRLKDRVNRIPQLYTPPYAPCAALDGVPKLVGS